jgi:hypothetical protein
MGQDAHLPGNDSERYKRDKDVEAILEEKARADQLKEVTHSYEKKLWEEQTEKKLLALQLKHFQALSTQHTNTEVAVLKVQLEAAQTINKIETGYKDELKAKLTNTEQERKEEAQAALKHERSLTTALHRRAEGNMSQFMNILEYSSGNRPMSSGRLLGDEREDYRSRSRERRPRRSRSRSGERRPRRSRSRSGERRPLRSRSRSRGPSESECQLCAATGHEARSCPMLSGRLHRTATLAIKDVPKTRKRRRKRSAAGEPPLRRRTGGKAPRLQYVPPPTQHLQDMTKEQLSAIVTDQQELLNRTRGYRRSRSQSRSKSRSRE